MFNIEKDQVRLQEKQLAEYTSPNKKQVEQGKKLDKVFKENRQKSNADEAARKLNINNTKNLISELEESAYSPDLSESNRLSRLAQAQSLRNELSLYDSSESAAHANDALMEQQLATISGGSLSNKLKSIEDKAGDFVEHAAHKYGYIYQLFSTVKKYFREGIANWLKAQDMPAEKAKAENNPSIFGKLGYYAKLGAYNIGGMLLKVFDTTDNLTNSAQDILEGLFEQKNKDFTVIDPEQLKLKDEKKYGESRKQISTAEAISNAQTLAEEKQKIDALKTKNGIDDLFRKMYGKDVYNEHNMNEISSFKDLKDKGIIEIDETNGLRYSDKLKPNVSGLSKEDKQKLSEYITALYDHDAKLNANAQQAINILSRSTTSNDEKTSLRMEYSQIFKDAGINTETSEAQQPKKDTTETGNGYTNPSSKYAEAARQQQAKAAKKARETASDGGTVRIDTKIDNSREIRVGDLGNSAPGAGAGNPETEPNKDTRVSGVYNVDQAKTANYYAEVARQQQAKATKKANEKVAEKESTSREDNAKLSVNFNTSTKNSNETNIDPILVSKPVDLPPETDDSQDFMGKNNI